MEIFMLSRCVVLLLVFESRVVGLVYTASVFEESCNVTNCTIKPNLPCEVTTDWHCTWRECFSMEVDSKYTDDDILNVDVSYESDELGSCRGRLNITWSLNECDGAPFIYYVLEILSVDTPSKPLYILFNMDAANWTDEDLSENMEYSYSCFYPYSGLYTIELRMYNEGCGWISTQTPWQIEVSSDYLCSKVTESVQNTTQLPPRLDETTTPPSTMPLWTAIILAVAVALVITVTVIVATWRRHYAVTNSTSRSDLVPNIDEQRATLRIGNNICEICEQRHYSFISPATSPEPPCEDDATCEHCHFSPPEGFEDNTSQNSTADLLKPYTNILSNWVY